MNNYKTIKFSKSSFIYEEGNFPKDYFYIITKGKAVSYAINSDNYNKEYKVGHIIGLVNLAAGEPYSVSMKAEEDVEVLELSLSDINNITNNDLIKTIYNYFNTTLETWLSRYYINLVKNKVDLYYKENIFTMAEIYIKNEFPDTAYRLYENYIDTLEDKDDIESTKKELSKLPKPNDPSIFTSNIFLYKKGSSLFTEFKASNYLYIILSGRIGIYNIINGKLLLKDIYKKNYVLDGYEPKLEYKPLLTSAIALEESYVKIVTIEEYVEMLIKDKHFRSCHVKMMSMKVINILSRIKAIEEKNTILKLFIFISALLKIETLFEDINTTILSYTIYDIQNSLNLEINDIINNLKEIKSLEIVNDKYIRIDNINDFFQEYYEYQKNNY
ncbi:putative cAMP-binding protein [Brachyspira hampsonii 30446]|uniref:Putative cAMP-binding protein n=2 Tax=Brachyspira hampsonii TaxID=1287055 RepID=A0A2U4EXT9_9SPIR|nr:cyclic nucleotide-binding domain-containing protein [Brachyspira hampsonii]EKV56122.1 putative cAMP-binding protein [Brachyspira hampsonii 30446]MBW5395835.1 cyclic nucleotide-binding domain-containing protein [Brachyspira hampsonii]OEJ18038.1 cAMP-binding protein [Brachyspira hampsonii]